MILTGFLPELGEGPDALTITLLPVILNPKQLLLVHISLYILSLLCWVRSVIKIEHHTIEIDGNMQDVKC